MQIIIHRGTKEIGGSCVEIKTAKTRLLVDFGMPLVTADRKPFDSKELRGKSAAELKKSKILPDIPGLYKGEAKSIDAVVISHSHPDHRMVSAYKACLKTGTTFVIDLYTAYVLERLSKVSKNIPQFDWRNVRVKFYKNQADILSGKVSKKLLYRYNKRKIEMEEISSKKDKILMLSRFNSIFPSIIKSIPGHNGARVIFPMWEGYLTEKFREYSDREGLAIERVHASGHAALEDLKAFANALRPQTLIPIHTFNAHEYPSLFENVKLLKDGEVLDLNALSQGA